jgi:hypothetical protein
MRRASILMLVGAAVVSLALAPASVAKKQKYDVVQTITYSFSNPPAGTRTAAVGGQLGSAQCGGKACPAKVARSCLANRRISTLATNAPLIKSTTAADGSFSFTLTYDGDFGASGGQTSPQVLGFRSMTDRVNVRMKRLKINCRVSYDVPPGGQVVFSP